MGVHLSFWEVTRTSGPRVSRASRPLGVQKDAAKMAAELAGKMPAPRSERAFPRNGDAPSIVEEVVFLGEAGDNIQP